MSAMRRVLVLTLALACSLPHPALAQTTSARTGAVVDRLNRSSMRPLPPLPPVATPRPDSIWVPDRYLSLPAPAGQVHVPGHWEQPVSPHEVYAPPLAGRASDGTLLFFPAGVRPTPDARQAP
jgi:hypothetical protein